MKRLRRPNRVLIAYLAAFVLSVYVQVQTVSSAQSTEGAVFYVSPMGNDSWSGKFAQPTGHADGPFATVARARDAIRALKASGQWHAPIRIVVRGGEYFLTEPLVFTPQDSGSQKWPITYAGYPGDAFPVLSGGRRITGWRALTQNTPGLPSIANGKVWEADIEKGWNPKELSVNYSAMPRAAISAALHWEQWSKGTATSDQTLAVPEGLVASLSNPLDADVDIRTGNPRNFVTPFQFDPTARAITFSRPRVLKPGETYFFRIENTLQGMLQPGNWCVNSSDGKIYLWPPNGVDPNRTNIVGARLLNVLELKGNEDAGAFVRFLNFHGLAFADADRKPLDTPEPPGHKRTVFDAYNTTDSAILVNGAEDCTFENCRITGAAGTGIRLLLYAKRINLLHNLVSQCGGNGIAIYGYNPGTHQEIKQILIDGNSVQYCGLTYWHSAGIALAEAGDTTIRSNTIAFMSYCGIMAGGFTADLFRQVKGKNDYARWNEIGSTPLTVEGVEPFVPGNLTIEDNVVHDTMMVAVDGGAIYLWGENHCAIRHNVVYRTIEDGSVGIYLDQDTMDTLVRDNLVYECPIAPTAKLGTLLLMNTGTRNIVTNNIFALGTRFLVMGGDRGGNSITRNIVMFRPTVASNQGLWPARESEKVTLTPSVIDYNLYWSSGGVAQVNRWFAVSRPHGWDRHSIMADPLFANVSQSDFHLRSGSPAYGIGFQPFL